ncbi:hypothetical protein ACTQ50_09485, partial [Blautia sp. Sow4_E7]|uniref:hypothetical protein n=1 Tax=Blautia sp. Sow4_E7 TaxID=3438749 RepID=UPI003F8F60A4
KNYRKMSARNLNKSLWRTEIPSDSGQKIPDGFGQNRSSVTTRRLCTGWEDAENNGSELAQK